MRRTLIILTILLAASTAEAKLRVVTTLPDFASMAQEIGGERVETIALVKGTQDPHYVDAKPSYVLAVNKADLFIRIGLGLEDGWLPVLLTKARNDDIQPGSPGYLDASQFITPKEIPVKFDKAMGDLHPGGNPHYYTGPEELLQVAGAIAAKLVELDPAGADYYTKRWKAFEAKFAKKEAEWKAKLATLKGKKVVVYHQSWIYLLDWLGVERLGSLEPKPGIPPSASHVTKMIAWAKKAGVTMLFQEIYHPKKLSKVFAKKVGAELLVLPSMVGAAPGIDTIWDKFDTIVDMVTK